MQEGQNGVPALSDRAFDSASAAPDVNDVALVSATLFMKDDREYIVAACHRLMDWVSGQGHTIADVKLPADRAGTDKPEQQPLKTEPDASRSQQFPIDQACPECGKPISIVKSGRFVWVTSRDLAEGLADHGPTGSGGQPEVSDLEGAPGSVSSFESSYAVIPCVRLGAHDPHTWTARSSWGPETLQCPGVPDDDTTPTVLHDIDVYSVGPAIGTPEDGVHPIVSVDDASDESQKLLCPRCNSENVTWDVSRSPAWYKCRRCGKQFMTMADGTVRREPSDSATATPCQCWAVVNAGLDRRAFIVGKWVSKTMGTKERNFNVPELLAELDAAPDGTTAEAQS